jgi:hypothetical protein
MIPRANAILLEPYKSREKQNMTSAVKVINKEFTERATAVTALRDRM